MEKQEFEKLLEVKNINFKVDKFEALILQDMTRFDEDTRIKLNRNLTKTFNEWLQGKLEAKEMVKINIKGETRSGKSLIGLKIIFSLTKFYDDKNFDTENQVCANQKEYRQKVAIAEFGDSFLVDENAFANVGIGSMSEVQQLKDVLNITAKKNLHTIFITPRAFLDTGATMGLAYYGKDTNNWLSRFLLYSLKNNMPTLLGYVVFDIGQLFKDSGCYLFKFNGGCNNTKKLTYEDIKNLYDGNVMKYSTCIPEKIDETKLFNHKKQCPFYNICKSQMLKYELKKDKWIEKELKGGLDEREIERYNTSIELLKLFGSLNPETQNIRLSAKNGKELKLKVKMKLPTISSTKYTGTEIDEIMTLLTSLTSFDFLGDVCKQLDLDYDKLMKELPISEHNNKK